MWLTGINPGKEVHAHHVFPQAHEWDFLQKGINIHDPQYLTWWEAGSHLPNTYEYNRKWAEFVRKNRWDCTKFRFYYRTT